MRISTGGPLDLTYCTNIHAADGWPAVLANIRRYAPALKARFAPHAPFGIGLRLSARDAQELLAGDRLQTFRVFLEDQGLYVAVINGFPYGPFHATPVKADVYAPDWREPGRVEYTLDLVRVLTALLPRHLDGGISTAPISYKAWMGPGTDSDWNLIAHNIARVAEALHRAKDEAGASIHLDIEPEPDCVVETTSEAVALFTERLLPGAGPILSRSIGVSADAAERLLAEHVQLCFDCCHVSVEHEDPIEAIRRLSAVGIRIGRVQLSSALRVTMPRDSVAAAATAARLRPFADSTYLHQVICRHDATLSHAADLDAALETRTPGDWRVHFHVPLFANDYGPLGSTQHDVRRVIAEARATGFTRHLEIETYTWDVLPANMKIDLLESIAREYQWVLDEWAGPAAGI